MWLVEGTGEWISGVETVMSVHPKTRHQPRTSTLVSRPDAVHDHVVLTHPSHVVSSSGQAGHARALTTSPGGSKSLKRIVKQCPGSTAARWANDIENTLIQPTYQI